MLHQAISIESVIDDLHANANRETRLVEFVMRRSQPILEHNLDNLSSELLGYLLPYASALRPGLTPADADASPPPPPAPSAVEAPAATDGHPNSTPTPNLNPNLNPNNVEASGQLAQQQQQLSPTSSPSTTGQSQSKSSNADARFLYANIKYLLDQCDHELQNNAFIPIFPYSSLSVNFSLLNAVDIRQGTPLISSPASGSSAAPASAASHSAAAKKAAPANITGASASRRRNHNLLAEAVELKQHKLDAKVAYDVTFKSMFFIQYLI